MWTRQKVVANPAWETWLRQRGLMTFAAWFDATAGTVRKQVKAAEVRQLSVDGRELFLKKYWSDTPRQLWSGMLRGTFFGRSKVRREFENLQQLRAWGLDAPAPVVYGEQRRAGWLVRSFLVSEAVPAAVPLDAVVTGQRPAGLLPALAAMLRRLHERGFAHGDLYWRNILLSGGSLDHFYLIDAHRGGRWRREPAGRARDLAALDGPAPWYFRRSERLRFFLAYRQHRRLTTEDKTLVREVLRQAEPLRLRQLRRVREAHR